LNVEDIPVFETPQQTAEWLRGRGWRQLGVTGSPGCMFRRPDRPAAGEWKERLLSYYVYSDERGEEHAAPIVTQAVVDGAGQSEDGPSFQTVVVPAAQPMTMDQAVQLEVETAMSRDARREQLERDARFREEASTPMALSRALLRLAAARKRQ
jgi:hypothetical protein